MHIYMRILIFVDAYETVDAVHVCTIRQSVFSSHKDKATQSPYLSDVPTNLAPKPRHPASALRSLPRRNKPWTHQGGDPMVFQHVMSDAVPYHAVAADTQIMLPMRAHRDNEENLCTFFF